MWTGARIAHRTALEAISRQTRLDALPASTTTRTVTMTRRQHKVASQLSLWQLWLKLLRLHYSACRLPPGACPVLLCGSVRQKVLSDEAVMEALRADWEKHRALASASMPDAEPGIGVQPSEGSKGDGFASSETSTISELQQERTGTREEVQDGATASSQGKEERGE